MKLEKVLEGINNPGIQDGTGPASTKTGPGTGRKLGPCKVKKNGKVLQGKIIKQHGNKYTFTYNPDPKSKFEKMLIVNDKDIIS